LSRSKGRKPSVEKKDLDLIEKYIDKDDELKKRVVEHGELEKKLEELNSKPYLTADQEVEVKRLKKMKLAGRDKIEEILKRYR
jgi:uncharacterized protein YdcH (DUF465 family)